MKNVRGGGTGVHKTKGLAIDVKRLELNIHTRPQKQKRFYNRETLSALYYEIHQMYFLPIFPSMQLK